MKQAAEQEIHIVMMVILTKIPPILFWSSGYDEAYYKHLVLAGIIPAETRGINEFAKMCEGTKLYKKATKLVQFVSTAIQLSN